ncbi:MAG TPA: hypothetical protein VI756_08255 [Blastocatellia bacterium]
MEAEAVLCGNIIVGFALAYLCGTLAILHLPTFEKIRHRTGVWGILGFLIIATIVRQLLSLGRLDNYYTIMEEEKREGASPQQLPFE